MPKIESVIKSEIMRLTKRQVRTVFIPMATLWPLIEAARRTL
jgi:hypothetical protein